MVGCNNLITIQRNISVKVPQSVPSANTAARIGQGESSGTGFVFSASLMAHGPCIGALFAFQLRVDSARAARFVLPKFSIPDCVAAGMRLGLRVGSLASAGKGRSRVCLLMSNVDRYPSS